MNEEPRWLTDYENILGLDLASRLHRRLLQQFRPLEREGAHGRVVYLDPLLQSQAYMVLSQERIHLALVKIRQANQPVQTLAPVPYMLVDHYEADSDGRWVRLTTRGYQPVMVPEPVKLDDEADIVIQAGKHGRDLIAALVDVIDESLQQQSSL